LYADLCYGYYMYRFAVAVANHKISVPPFALIFIGREGDLTIA